MDGEQMMIVHHLTRNFFMVLQYHPLVGGRHPIELVGEVFAAMNFDPVLTEQRLRLITGQSSNTVKKFFVEKHN